ncbi:MAG: hypothetical protein IPK12_08410 [Gemmatimonadetes bacterium]|nr:hypothetical protein [Gemmatimonadota bacterium]
MPRSWVLFPGVLMLATCAPTIAGSDGLPLSPAEQVALRPLLAAHPGARLAQRADHTAPLLADYLVDHPGFHPYFSRADLDQSGRPDLLVALVARGARGPEFTLYFFRDSAAGFGAPVRLGQPQPFADSAILPAEGGLYLGPLESDAGFFFTWNPVTGRLEEVPDSTS